MPSGVYVRQGASSAPASYEQIHLFIMQSDGEEFESSRSMLQELTFDSATTEFDRCSVHFTDNNRRSLGLIGEDANLALLLSDQCKHSIKMAVLYHKCPLTAENMRASLVAKTYSRPIMPMLNASVSSMETHE